MDPLYEKRFRPLFNHRESSRGRVVAELQPFCLEENDSMTKRVLMLGAAGVMLLTLSACATRGDVDELRSEIASVRAIAQAADQKATAAQAEAQAASAAADIAAADAAEASRKADEIFRAGLRK
jgi:hypothetical protein